MDKYVKRLSREEFEDQRHSKRPRLRQATLQSLKGVIDVKRVLVLKARLECRDSTEHQIKTCLEEIKAERCLPIQILTETGIGRVIGPLRKHENITISSISKQLVDQWKQKIKDLPVAPVVRTSENKPLSLLMDNSRNAGSEDVRLRAVRLLRDNIESGEDDDYKHNQSKEIEKKIFIENNQKIDKNYKAKVRQAVFKLKRLKNGEASHS